MYHGGCPDGFGGAYSAWKKLGDHAEYHPVSYSKPVPENLASARIYFIDCCYKQDVMDKIVAEAHSLTILDHHTGTQAVVESMPEHVFDNDRSGAMIAWNYFNPDVPAPKLLEYIQDDDLFLFKLPDTRPVLAYVLIRPFTFEEWEVLVQELEDPESREVFLNRARIYGEYFELLGEFAAEHVKLVEFEGYEVTFATAHPMKPMKSLVGNLLAKKHPPFSLVATAHPEGYGISIRGDGSVDVSAIARKYGGNGHHDSAGFAIPADGNLPWKLIEKAEED